MAITRDKIANVLEEIALLMELKDENSFKVKAYRAGAEIVRSYPDDIVVLARDDKLTGIKGIGDALREKIHELATTGNLVFHQNLRAEFPATLFELFELQGLGPKKIKLLHRDLAIRSITDLKAACDTGKIAALPGFGSKTQENILLAIAQREKSSGLFRLDQVAIFAEKFLNELRENSSVLRVAACGSYRRGKEIIGDLDLLAAASEPNELIAQFVKFPSASQIIAQGDTKASILLENGLQCDLRVVSNDQFPFALQYFTGSKEHNVALRQRALTKGWSLNEYAFTVIKDNAETIPEVNEEHDIYKSLGLQFIEPELRENRGEIEAAEKQELPHLIELQNLRGTFHSHTTASDGHHSLEQMSEAAIELGLEYLGVSDHSKSSPQANGLYEDRLLQQVEETKKLNTEFEKFRLFAGSEVDILKDGSLDFDDGVLRQLDFVVASVHNSFTLSEDEMTKRIIRAMENPYVTMIGHLTGRILLRRESYAVNHAKIIDCAAETKTVIELNCNPKRFDMDWRWWHRARNKGVLCSINTDAHDVNHFGFLHYGIMQARKGWLRRADVINTMSLEKITKFLTLPKNQRTYVD
jgi:DNA polymerase (family X)